MRIIADNIGKMIEAPILAMGYELVGIEYLSTQKPAVLRVYIDHEAGVTVDDCQSVSHQVSGILDVEDPIESEYLLEISSPGLDRPLFQKKDFVRFQGSNVKVRMRIPLNGRRNFKGHLDSVNGDILCVVVDDEVFNLNIDDIDKANLIADNKMSK